MIASGRARARDVVAQLIRLVGFGVVAACFGWASPAAGEDAGEIASQFGWLNEQYKEEYRRAVDRIAGFLTMAMKAIAFLLVIAYVLLMIQGAAGLAG